MRIDGDKTEEYIDRKFEFFAISFLSKNSLGAKILLKFKNGMISEFVPGTDLATKEIIDPIISKKIAVHLADIHKLKIDDVPEIVNREPFILSYMELYYSKIPKAFTRKENQERFEDFFRTRNIERDVFEVCEKIKTCRPLFALGHNDLVVGNFLYNEKEDQVRFIDFEYVEKNYRQADVGNMFTGSVEVSTVVDFNSGFSPEGKKDFVEAYLKEFGFTGEELEKEVEIWMKEVPIFELASHLLWGVWALFQAEYSPHDFDFLGYALHRYRAFEAVFEPYRS